MQILTLTLKDQEISNERVSKEIKAEDELINLEFTQIVLLEEDQTFFLHSCSGQYKGEFLTIED